MQKTFLSHLRRKPHKLSELLPAPVAPKHAAVGLQLHRGPARCAEPLGGLLPDRHVCMPAVFIAHISVTEAADCTCTLLDVAFDQACLCRCGDAAAATAAPGRVTLPCQWPAQRRERQQGCHYTSQHQCNAQGVRPWGAPGPGGGRKRLTPPTLVMMEVLLQQVLLLRGLLLLLVQVELKVIGLPYLEIAAEATLAVCLKGR